MKNQQHHSGNCSTDKLYFTSDGLAFFEEQNAHSHAKHLRDKTVTAKTRDEVYMEMAAITGENRECEMDELLDELSASYDN